MNANEFFPRSRVLNVSILAVAVIPLGNALAASQRPLLVPPPRQIEWSDSAPLKMPREGVAIVIGAKATAPEQRAALMFSNYLSRRFDCHWPIVHEGEVQEKHKAMVVLGQRNGCKLVDDLCRKHGIELNDSFPGPDGYVIQVVNDGDREIVLVGGCNPRGVEYGQDTLIQMFQSSGSDLELARATIADAPAIRWRGRPQTHVSEYLRPGELDLYITSRINFIDLRSGIYAFEPGEKLNHAQITEVIREAHQRGLIVYATVNCGVPEKEYAKVLGTFDEMLGLGADGLWLSFDDKGPGDKPIELVTRVLDLGRQHQIADHLIAITPPKGSYQKIATDFNRKIMSVPGMERANWFWTSVPSSEESTEARNIGLKVKRGWWHNWPRLFSEHDYVGIPPLSLGWSAPDYDQLRQAGDCLDAAMPWGGNAFGQHYVVPVIGWWAWNPKTHDWDALRRRVFGIVFGKDQIDRAMRFDEDIKKLSAYCVESHKNTSEFPAFPPRPISTERKNASNLVSSLTASLTALSTNAPTKSLLPLDELNSRYLKRMRKELEVYTQSVRLDFPEDWWPAQQRQILTALYSTNDTGAQQLISKTRGRALAQVKEIAAAFPSYPHIRAYTNWWINRVNLNPGDWRTLLQRRRAALAVRAREYSAQTFAAASMVDAMLSPPMEWGIGRWQSANQLLATVVPSQEEQFWGDWLAGVREEHGISAAVFAAERKSAGEPGEYSELPVSVPISGRRDRLALLLMASGINKDLFSNTMTRYRWAGYRFLTLLWNDKVLWETDVGTLLEKGQWFMIRLPALPGEISTLPLRLRVEDRQMSLNNYTIVYVSPLRLLQLPE